MEQSVAWDLFVVDGRRNDSQVRNVQDSWVNKEYD